MKTSNYLIIISLLLSSFTYAQKSEYQYFSIRLGASHGFSAQPGMNNNKYLATPDGEMQLSPVSSFMGYTPGFVGDLFFNYDLPNNSSGIVLGLEYNSYGLASKYETEGGKFTLVERHKINAVGIPLFFKFGPKLYKNQRYGYAGVQYNYNITMKVNQKVNWTNKVVSAKVSTGEFNKSSMVIFLGFNWKVINIQFDYIPGSFFNQEFIDPAGYKPYVSQPSGMFFLKTSFNTPTNAWLGSQSYGLKRFLKKIAFWK